MIPTEPKIPWKRVFALPHPHVILVWFLVGTFYVFHSLGWAWWLAALMSIALLGFATTVPRVDSTTLLWVILGSFVAVAGILLYGYLQA